MQFSKTNHRQLIALVLIVSTVFGYFTVKIMKQNIRYEEYVNFSAMQILGKMEYSLNQARITINKANNRNDISSKELYDLWTYHHEFLVEIQELPNVYYTKLGSKYKSKYNNIIYENNFSEQDMKLMQLYNQIIQNKKSTTVYKFDDEDKKFLHELQKMNNSILEIFRGESYKYLIENFSKTKNEWIEIFIQIDNACSKDYSKI